MFELPISSDSWTWKDPEYECMASGVGTNNVEGLVDASEGASLHVGNDCCGWVDADVFLPEPLKTHSLPLDAHLEHGYCLSHLIFDSVHEAQDLRRVRLDLSTTFVRTPVMPWRITRSEQYARIVAALLMSGQEIAPSELRVASLIDCTKIICKIIEKGGTHIAAVQSFVCVFSR